MTKNIWLLSILCGMICMIIAYDLGAQSLNYQAPTSVKNAQIPGWGKMTNVPKKSTATQSPKTDMISNIEKEVCKTLELQCIFGKPQKSFSLNEIKECATQLWSNCANVSPIICANGKAPAYEQEDKISGMPYTVTCGDEWIDKPVIKSCVTEKPKIFNIDLIASEELTYCYKGGLNSFWVSTFLQNIGGVAVKNENGNCKICKFGVACDPYVQIVEKNNELDLGCQEMGITSAGVQYNVDLCVALKAADKCQVILNVEEVPQ
jgi:hypothetical protein